MSNTFRLSETFSICLLFVSVFISKAGIYISLTLILFIQLYILFHHENVAKSILRDKVSVVCLLLFFLGLLSTLYSPSPLHDSALYFRKGAIFLLLPILMIQLRRTCNYASLSIIFGLLIAIIYSTKKLLELNGGTWSGERIDSFWDIGRWGEILSYILAILIPLIFSDEHKKQNLFIKLAILFICVMFILLSGGRGPLLAIAISSSLFMVFKRPKTLCFVFIIGLLLLILGKDTPQVKAVSERVTSITELHHNDSNSARIEMWKKGLAFIYQNAYLDPGKFILGTGLSSFEKSYTLYLENNYDMAAIKKDTGNQFSFKDVHNTYLDLAAKLGILYALVYIILIATIFKYFFLLCKNEASPWAFSGLCLVLTYFINSFFYTSGLEYQTTAFFSLLVLCQAQHRSYIRRETS